MIHKDTLNDMKAWPDKLKRLIARRYKIDLNNSKTGFKGEPLSTIDEYHEDILGFAFTVFQSQQVEINRLKSASSNFLTAFSELQEAVKQ
jgi:hypothetical protein